MNALNYDRQRYTVLCLVKIRVLRELIEQRQLYAGIAWVCLALNEAAHYLPIGGFTPIILLIRFGLVGISLFMFMRSFIVEHRIDRALADDPR